MKLLIVISLSLISAFAAGLYGALHDQFTYTISPEFYTLVRFEQMGITKVPPRIGAAIVGWKNTWPIGLFLGAILSIAGLMHRKEYRIFKYTLVSIMIAMGVAAIFGLLGVVITAYVKTGENSYLKLPSTIVNKEAFRAVQTIHNFSYMGSVAGMLLGLLWQFYKRKQTLGLGTFRE